MPWWFTVSTFSRNPMTSADEVREIRERKLGMDRTAFGLALGIKGKGSAYAQVRKWEAGVVAPSDAALTAMRLLVELQECRRLPWMTEELWRTAQIAQNELRAMAVSDETWKMVTIAQSRIDGSMEYFTDVTRSSPASEIAYRTAEHRAKSEQFPGQLPFRAWHLIGWCEITEEMALEFDPNCIDNEA
jgi:DNA-binding transcriptional regulator YiaG